MAVNEVTVPREGTLWWVEASGTARGAWSTGTTPPSGLIGIFDSFTYKSAQDIETIYNRGMPDHDKITKNNRVDLSVNLLVTGGTPPKPTNNYGATVPAYHLQARYSAEHKGAGSAHYMMFMGVPFESIDFSEGEKANTYKISTHALGMIGPTASGYIAT